MREVRLRLIKPHESQRSVLGAAKRFNVLCCGRRWGKTTLAIDVIIRKTLQQKKKCGWFSPTYKDLAEAWRDLARMLKPITTRRNDQEKRLEFIGGGSLDGWSLDDPDSGRGRAYHIAVIDEAARIDLEHAWQQTVRPMLTDYRGDAWFLSTPRGVASYFYKLWRDGMDPTKPDWASWQIPSTANPYLPSGEIDDARQDLSDLAFSQEYLAQFVTWAGSVFRRIQEATTRPGAAGPCVVIGVDWGQVNDYTVFAGLSEDGAVVGTERFRGVEYAIARDRLKAFWERMGRRAVICAETNSIGVPNGEQLVRDGLPVVGFTTTAASKAQIIQQLALAFERGVIRIPDDPLLIGELQAFEGKQAPSGMKYSAPAGQHDDYVMALAIAWNGLGAALAERTRHQIVRPPMPTISIV